MHIIKAYIFIILSLLVNDLNAQFTVVQSNTQANLLDVHFFDAQLGLAVGDSGVIVKSVDGGLTWNKVMQNDTVSFKKVRFFTPQDAIAIGSDIFISSNGGASWARTSTNGNLIDYTDMEIINDSTSYISSWQGELLKTTDRGNNFSVVFGGSPNVDMGLISFLSDSLGYACGYSGGLSTQTLKTIDGGLSWTTILDSTQNGNPTVMEEMIFISEDVGFKAGWYNPHLQKTSNGAENWNYPTMVDSTVTYQLIDMFISPSFPNAYYACGWYGELYKSTDGGETWNGLEAGLSSSQSLYGIFFIDDNNGWVVGSEGFIMKITNGGIGIEEDTKTNQLKLFPNPASDVLHLEWSENMILEQVEVFSMEGRCVLHPNIDQDAIRVSNLKQGMYILKATTNLGITMEVFIKE